MYKEMSLGVRYPESTRQRCDLCLGTVPAWTLALEVKLLRLLGDNGKLNDNMVMHLISPYPEHRSALTDCAKLRTSKMATRKAVLIYGFEDDKWPMEPLIEAFETLAGQQGGLGPRIQASFEGLIHPIHSKGWVYAWGLLP